RDPETRLLDELFWFWPQSSGLSAPDPALDALAGGNVEQARQIWQQRAQTPDGSVARHNLAVLAHVLALACEGLVAGPPFADARPLLDVWREALAGWAAVLRDDAFWEQLRRRIAARNEPQLPAALAGRLREDLPVFLAGINAQLAVRA